MLTAKPLNLSESKYHNMPKTGVFTHCKKGILHININIPSISNSLKRALRYNDITLGITTINHIPFIVLDIENVATYEAPLYRITDNEEVKSVSITLVDTDINMIVDRSRHHEFTKEFRTKLISHIVSAKTLSLKKDDIERAVAEVYESYSVDNILDKAVKTNLKSSIY